MRSITKALKLIVACAVICMADEARQASSIYSWTPKTHVHVKNNMGDGSKIIVHCNSIDDDLGQQMLVDGQEYEFVFHPLIWLFGNTQFFCEVSGEKGKISWTAYDHNRDETKCFKVCVWNVNGDGVNGGEYMTDFHFYWNS